MTYLNLTI